MRYTHYAHDDVEFSNHYQNQTQDCEIVYSESCAVLQVATYREQKKLADKQRKLQEKAHRVKEESLRDDDNVFDVAFENQGGEAAEHTVSATDIKVGVLAF